MTEANKRILEKANAAIAEGDFEGFLVHCTEDTVWTFEGERTLAGKDAVRQWMATAYAEPPRFEVERLIAGEGHVVALGEIELDGERHRYCDVWRFRGDLMAGLHAFVVKAA
jgi:uncharacterized protein